MFYRNQMVPESRLSTIFGMVLTLTFKPQNLICSLLFPSAPKL